MCMCMCMCMHMPLLATALTALGPSSGRAAPAFLIHQHPRGAGSALLCANATLEAPRKPRVVTRFFTLRVASLTAGIVGAFASAFVVVEGWPVVDALYFTATTFATIGFGDLKPVRPAGRLLTSMCGVAGVGLLGGLVSATLAAWREEFEEEEAGERSAAPWLRPWQGLLALFSLGVVGFKLSEGASWSRAAYLIIGTLSTAGLGDVVPTTSAAKLFLACYAPLAVCAFARAVGAVALRPLDRARRRAQRAVLERYRGRLTPRTFDEVCSGPLVQKLGLSDNDATCTRDQFTLLTLVMQGKVSERDLDECRAAFAALDATRSGRLTTEDLEAWQQARQLRVESFLYRRRVRKLARLGGALGPTHTATATYATPLHTLDTPRHPSTPHRQTPPLDIAPPLPLRTLTPNTLPQRR